MTALGGQRVSALARRAPGPMPAGGGAVLADAGAVAAAVIGGPPASPPLPERPAVDGEGGARALRGVAGADTTPVVTVPARRPL
mmetsp:Transcript_2344/g.5869  ORF Transcript_2344/g.5869 Transcript_2344/m.5869 type:complete len:84 (-) Transcript_2344:963-1214(-)